MKTSLRRALELEHALFATLQFLFIPGFHFELHELPIYKLKRDLSFKFLKNSPMGAWQLASHEWKGSSVGRVSFVQGDFHRKLLILYNGMRTSGKRRLKGKLSCDAY